MTRANDKDRTAVIPAKDTTRSAPSAEELELAQLREATRARLFGTSGPPATVGRYRILESIGAGGMGAVYLAHDDDLDRQVAVKLLHTATHTGHHSSARLIREAQAMAKLSHPNVVHVYEVGRRDDRVFIAMEFIPGPTLREWSARDRTVPELVAMHRQAGLGLAAAHEAGLVHRDYKPDNVLVDPKGRARVLDFGLARPDEIDGSTEPSRPDDPDSLDVNRSGIRLTETGTVLGTPAYMSPEQLDGHRADARSDQFSFCVTLFEALYAQRPFPGDTFAALRAAVLAGRLRPVDPAEFGVPDDVHAAIVRALQVDPDARFPSMHALLDALDARPGPAGRSGWRRAAVLGGLAAALGVGAAVAWPSSEGSAPRDPPREDPVELTPSPYAEILATSDLPEPLPEPLPDDPYQITIHRLRNGLTVYISPDHDAPMLAAAVVVRAGPIDERPGGTGAAHLLEHALTGGTARLGALDYERERPLLERRNQLALELEDTEDPERRSELLTQIEQVAREAAPYGSPLEYTAILTAAGAKNENNSRTFPTMTMFYAVLPSVRLPLWAQLEAERLRHPVFRNFFSSLGPVNEEIRRDLGRDVPTIRALRRALFGPNDPRANDVLGRRDDVERPPFSAMLDLHRRRYVPNNTAIVLVGNTDASTAIPVIEEAFGDWEPRPVEPRPEAPAPRPPGRVGLEGSSSQLPLVLAWPLPPQDRTAWEDMMQVLAYELSLRSDEDAIEGWTEIDELADSTSALGLVPAPHASAEEAEAEIFELLRALQRDGPPAPSLARVDSTRRRRVVDRRRDPVALVKTLAMSYGRSESWSRRVEAEHRTPASPSSIRRFARSLLESGFVVLVHDPKREPEPSFELPVADRVDHTAPSYSEFAQRLFAAPVLELEPQFILEGRHYQVDREGPTLKLSTRVDDGLTTISLVFRLDRRADHRLHTAILWLTSGAADHSFEDRQRRWAELGISATLSYNEVEIQLDIEVLSDHLDEAWPSLSQWLTAPRPTESSFVHAHRLWRSIRKTARKDTDQTLELLVQYAKNGTRSMNPTAMGSRAPSSSADLAWAARLAALVERRPSVVLYAGVGDMPTAWRDAASPASPAATKTPPYRATKSTRPRVVVMDAPGAEHAQLRILLTRSPLPPTDHVLADLLEAYLASGERGLLQYELRVSRALLYWATASFERSTTPADDATLRIRADAAPDRVAEVIDLVLESLERPVTADSLAHAKDQLEAQYRGRRIEPSMLPDRVLQWRNAGFDRDPLLTKWPALSQVTVPQLEAFKHTVTSEHPPVIVIRGDLDRIGRDTLARFGDVESVTLDDLCGAE